MPRPVVLRWSSRSGRVTAVRRSYAGGGGYKIQAPGENDRTGLGPGGEVMPGQDLVFQSADRARQRLLHRQPQCSQGTPGRELEAQGELAFSTDFPTPA